MAVLHIDVASGIVDQIKAKSRDTLQICNEEVLVDDVVFLHYLNDGKPDKFRVSVRSVIPDVNQDCVIVSLVPLTDIS